jgi:hypothetical protein
LNAIEADSTSVYKAESPFRLSGDFTKLQPDLAFNQGVLGSIPRRPTILHSPSHRFRSSVAPRRSTENR